MLQSTTREEEPLLDDWEDFEPLAVEELQKFAIAMDTSVLEYGEEMEEELLSSYIMLSLEYYRDKVVLVENKRRIASLMEEVRKYESTRKLMKQ